MPTLECLSRDALKEYLSGWTDAEQCDAIESHLSQCSDCEQTIHALERDPETLIEFVRNSRTPSAAQSQDADSAIAYAISRAKKLSTEPSEPATPWQPPAGDFGPYELLRPLGHGWMATVYLARHRQLGKQVAIKLLPSRPFRNDHYAARFQREIRTAGQLNHPAIVSATDAGEQAGTHYLVMEYIDGLDLSRVARFTGQLSIADACAIMRTVAIGLSHAHAEGIVHRDIKPSNLMLSSTGDVKILDFGLAQVSLWDEVSAELTTVGQLMGTLDYMAPEQAERPEAVDYRADLYSLGATLFRLLCGRAPLAAAPDLSPLVKLRLLASHQPPRLDTLRTDAPEKLVEFVAQLLARNPADRPASAAHVAEQLAEFAESADLTALISTAKSQSNTEHATATFVTLSPAISAQPSSSRTGRSTWRWLLTASLLPLLILGGVLITLETQKGTLVIQSESANVEVKLLREGELYEKLKIVPGVNSTRLYAGKYEVVIDAGSDSFSFDQPEIEITRGDTVIARVQRDATPRDSADPDLEMAPASTGPVFEGRTLQAWLNIFERERSPEERLKSLAALYYLASDDQARSEILPVLQRVNPAAFEPTGDNLHFDTLSKCMPDRRQFIESIAGELDKGNEEYRDRILDYLAQKTREGKFKDLHEFAPVRKWITANILKSNTSHTMLQQAVRLFLGLHGSMLSESDGQSLIEDLLGCERLGFDYWLSSPNSVVINNQDVPWTPQFAAAVESKAIEALSSPETDANFIVQALIILDVVHSSNYQKRNLKPSVALPEVLTALKVQVDRAAQEESFALQMLPLSGVFMRAKSRDPSPVRALNTFPCNLSAINFTNGDSSVNMGLELLQALRLLKFGDQALPLVEKMIDLTSTEAHRFALATSSLYETPAYDIVLQWPTLEFEYRDQKVSETQVLSYLIFDCAFSLLPAEDQQRLKAEHLQRLKFAWIEATVTKLDKDADGKLSYGETFKELAVDTQAADMNQDQFLSPQELLEYYEKSPLDSDVAAEVEQAKQPVEAEPIYEGKPLSEWLELFVRERSPSGTGNALEAMAALVSPSTAKRVETTLLEHLPTLGNRQFVYGNDSGVVDNAAFPVLASCFATRKDYFAMVATQLESANEDWARRILNSAFALGWAPDEVEPAVAWIEARILKADNRKALIPDAAKLFVDVNRGRPLPEDFNHRLMKSLADCKHIELNFWLRSPLVTFDGANTQRRYFNIAFERAVEGKAIEAIVADDTSEALVAQAAIMLNMLNTPDNDRNATLERRDNSELIDAIARRLQAAVKNPAQLFAIQKIDRNLINRPRTTVKSVRPTISSYLCRIYEKDDQIATASSTFELLNLASTLGIGANFESELINIIDITRQAARHTLQEASDSNTPRGAGLFNPIELDQPIARPATLTGKDCLSYMLFTTAVQLLPHPRNLEIETSELFVFLDANQDGSLSKKECEEEMPVSNAIDADGNETISQGELMAYVTHPEKFPPKPIGLDWQGWAFFTIARYDSNHDNRLTADEWNQMAVKPEGADSNKDGRIDAGECWSFFSRGK
ncbi:MAG: protein kinase [Pirellulaceae bacterium]|nr:protein kinase [Pirellulaceae bacterium]